MNKGKVLCPVCMKRVDAASHNRTWQTKRKKALTKYNKQCQKFWKEFYYSYEILELKRRVKILS